MHAYNKTLLIIHKTKQKQLYQDYKKTTTTKTIKTQKIQTIHYKILYTYFIIKCTNNFYTILYLLYIYNNNNH